MQLGNEMLSTVLMLNTFQGTALVHHWTLFFNSRHVKLAARSGPAITQNHNKLIRCDKSILIFQVFVDENVY